MDLMDHGGFRGKPLSRRAMLRLLGATGGALTLAGCGVSTATTQSGGATGSFNNDRFLIQKSAAKVPTGAASLQWMDSGDTKATYFQNFFPVFTGKYPNVKVNYNGTSWNEISQVITLGLQNGNPPDVFELPSNVTAAQAVANGWVGTFDEIVPNWSKVLKSFQSGVFQAGINQFGGKTYGYPIASNRRFGSHLLFNRDLLQKAGYDFDTKVVSWDEFRAAAKKVTQQGAGKYYGYITGLTQANAFSGEIDTLAMMAGAHVVNGIDMHKGEYAYASDEYVAATELMLAMHSDGSVFPGSTSIDEPGARGRMPQGVAAMELQGAWNIPIWKAANPAFNFGINLPPQENPKSFWPDLLPSLAADTYFYAKNTKNAELLGDIFYNLSQLDNQIMWAKYNGAGDPPSLTEAFAKSAPVLDKLDAKALKEAEQWTRLAPNPSARNPDVEMVNEALKPVTPNESETMVGLFTGQITGGVKPALQALDDRLNQALDAAIKVAKQKGAKVSRSDYVFKDWDPKKDYTHYGK